MPKAQRIYYCADCDSRFENRTHFNQHNISRHSKRRLNSTNVNHVTDNQDAERISQKSTVPLESSEPSHDADISGGDEGLPSSSTSIGEKASTSAVRKYYCTQCPTSFSRPWNLHRHIQLQHSDFAFSKECPICRLSLKSWEAYESHVRHCRHGKGFVRSASALRRKCSLFSLSLASEDESEVHPIASPSEILARHRVDITRTLHAIAREYGSAYVGVVVQAELAHTTDEGQSISMPLRASSFRIHSKMRTGEMLQLVKAALETCASRLEDLQTMGSGYSLSFFSCLQLETIGLSSRFGCPHSESTKAVMKSKGLAHIPQPRGDYRCFHRAIAHACMTSRGEPESFESWCLRELGGVPENTPVSFSGVEDFVKKYPSLSLKLFVYVLIGKDRISPITVIGKGTFEVQLLISECDDDTAAYNNDDEDGESFDNVDGDIDECLVNEYATTESGAIGAAPFEFSTHDPIRFDMERDECSSEIDEREPDFFSGSTLQPPRKKPRPGFGRPVIKDEEPRPPPITDHFYLITSLDKLLKLRPSIQTACKYCLAIGGQTAIDQHELECRVKDSGQVCRTTEFKQDSIKFTRVEASSLKEIRA